MDNQNINFKDLKELHDFIRKKRTGNILIGYRNLHEYTGMVIGIGIIFNIDKTKYELNIEWISFGLDLYGENLLESYLYKFYSLDELLEYLHSNYNILVTEIPLNYKIDPSLFPNPIKDSDQKPFFEDAWKKFQDDFKNGLFLDNSLHLVFSSSSYDKT